jgi:hypothetical protein
MAKDKLTEYDATANNNTVVGDVNLAENSALPSDMNNAVREIMSHQKEAFGSGTPLYVDQTNNRVGVGTSSPTSNRALHVSSTAQKHAKFERTGSATSQIEFSDSTTSSQPSLGCVGDNLTFETSNTERFRCDASGDFFLGTSSDIAPTNGTNLYISDGTISRIGLEKTGSNARKFSINNGGTYLSVYDETADAERLRIDGSSGNVMVGITSSDHKFTVNQGTVNKIGGMFYNNTSTNAPCLKVLQDGAGATGTALLVRQDGSGNAITVDDGSDGNTVFSVSQNGALSKASGSFKIKHPLQAKKDTHHLVHSFVEAPQADNIYRGKVDLVDGSATINIDTVSGMTDGTYVLLNTNTQCFTSNETGWTAVRGSVSGNILTITSQVSCTDTISWLVVGERHDQHMIDTDWTDDNGKVIVEPLKE